MQPPRVLLCIGRLFFGPQVLQAVPVPADVAARGQGSSSAGQAGSSAGQPRPPASGKRKRADDSTDAAAQPPSGQQQAGQEAAEDGRSEGASRQAASGGGGLEAPGGAQWGLRHAAELDEVVRWCGPIAAWELLRLQLKVRPTSCNYCFHESLHAEDPGDCTSPSSLRCGKF